MKKYIEEVVANGKELSAEEFAKLTNENVISRGKNFDKSKADYAEEYPQSTLEMHSVDKSKVSENSQSDISISNSDIQSRSISCIPSDLPRDVTHTETDKLGNTICFYDKPFIQDQLKTFPSTVRLLQKKVEVLDLGNEKEAMRFNELLNIVAKPFSNISNFTYSIKAFDNIATWKALVAYDILEFKNPLTS